MVSEAKTPHPQPLSPDYRGEGEAYGTVTKRISRKAAKAQRVVEGLSRQWDNPTCFFQAAWKNKAERRCNVDILTRKTDGKARLTLPTDFASCLVTIERQGDELPSARPKGSSPVATRSSNSWQE